MAQYVVDVRRFTPRMTTRRSALMDLEQNAPCSDTAAQGACGTCKKLHIAAIRICAHGFERRVDAAQVVG
jgi:hypothetical protein